MKFIISKSPGRSAIDINTMPRNGEESNNFMLRFVPSATLQAKKVKRRLSTT